MPYAVSTGTLFEGFETVGDWTVGGVGATAEADSTHVKTGTYGLKVTSVNNVSAYVTKTINQSFANMDRFTVWLYVDDAENYSQVSTALLYLSSTADFSKSYTVSIPGADLSSGWNKFTFCKADFTAAGGEDWANAMIRMRFRILSKAGATVSATLDSMYYGEYARPKCIIGFDDSNESDYTIAYDYMRKYGFRGVSYVIPDSTHIGAAGYLTTTEMDTMYAYGWEFGNHSFNHVDLTGLSDQAAVELELNLCRSWLASEGYTRNDGHKHMAIPFSAVDSKVLAAITATDQLTARGGTAGYVTPLSREDRRLYRQEALKATSLATMQGYVDRAIARGCAVMFNFHQLLAVPVDATDWATSDFQSLMDYIHSKKEQIDVVTVSEWLQGLTESRKKLI